MPNTPFTSKRAPVYADVPDEQWNNWRWQLSNRINTVEEFEKVIPLTDSERKALSAANLFRVDITPYFISLIDPNDPDDPIRKQVVPTDAEMVPFTAMMEDSLAEDRHSPVPGLVHRYPDRVLMLVTTQCASYCRYCTRSRIVGDPSATFSRAEFEMQIEYLQAHAAGAGCAALRRRPAGAGAQDPGRDPAAACARSRTSRSCASARACRSSCPCASPTSCATCCRSTTRCG